MLHYAVQDTEVQASTETGSESDAEHMSASHLSLTRTKSRLSTHTPAHHSCDQFPHIVTCAVLPFRLGNSSQIPPDTAWAVWKQREGAASPFMHGACTDFFTTGMSCNEAAAHNMTSHRPLACARWLWCLRALSPALKRDDASASSTTPARSPPRIYQSAKDCSSFLGCCESVRRLERSNCG